MVLSIYFHGEKWDGKKEKKNKNKNKKEKLEEKISGNEYYTQKQNDQPQLNLSCLDFL